jgi:transposase
MKHMAYTINPNIEKVRYQAYCLVNYQGWSVRKAARHLGYAHNTVLRWVKEKPCYNSKGQLFIPTRSSRPHQHPRPLSSVIISRILEIRAERHQCAEIIHHRLTKEGIRVSLSSVKRVLKCYGCSRYSRWKKWHQYPLRPLPKKPGVLVELDFLIEGRSQERHGSPR